MNKALLRVGVVAVVLVVGVAAGFLVGRHFPGPPSPADDVPRIRFRAGDDQVFTEPPKWREWQYPGSAVEDSGSGGDYTEMGIKYSVGQQAVLTTPDDFAKVCEFYKSKCELRHPGDQTITGRFDSGGSEKDFYLTVYETRHGNWFKGSKKRGTRTMGFGVSTLRYHLAGFVSRGKDDPNTQVMLVYRPLTEFLSVARKLRLKE